MDDGPGGRGMTDAELVRQTLAGRTEAFADLVHRWAGRVTAICHAKVGRAGAADDLAQETLLRAFRALPTLGDPERVGPWLCGIALRTCLDWLKARERRTLPFSVVDGSHPIDDYLPTRTEPEPEADRADEHRRLLRAVEELPEAYRTAVMLYYYDDLTYRELAALLGVSPATVNARLTKARQILRERLGSPLAPCGRGAGGEGGASPRDTPSCSANKPRP
jgi:RNA polymerase sigma factor (sigma-70 family)